MKEISRKAGRRRPITAEHLFDLRIPTSLSLSPDETRIAYTVERMDKKENKYFAHLFVHDLRQGASRQYTYGNHHDGQTAWSPDGEQIAFTSTRNKKVGIYLMPAGGGAERKLLEVEGSISNLSWSPDGKLLVFCLRYNDSHFIEDEKEKKKAPVYRHITRLFYRLDGTGFLPKDRFHVYRLEIASGRLKKLTSGQRDNIFPTVSPDGRWVAYVSNRHRNPDVEFLRDDLFVVPLAGGAEKKVPTPAGPIESPAFSPDSKSIAYVGHDNPDDDWGGTNTPVWKVGLHGKPKARDLMPGYDRNAHDDSITDTSDAHDHGRLGWSADGKRIYFVSSDTGRTNLYYIPARGGKPTCVFRGKCHIRSYHINGKARLAALVYGDLNNPGEIMTCPAQYGGEKKATKHTDLNRFLRTEVQLGRTRDIMFRSFDGTEVQGWMVLPPNFNPNRRYPSILQIHGGPRVQYAYTFFHEMQYLAAKGYVVFYTNPRGGCGRGETWARAIAGGWGELDYKDCMAAADYLEKQRFINRNRMGVTGGSYGGYMTNWIIGRTNRFKAAVTQRSVVDLKSFFGSSDIGWSLMREFDGFPWNNKENYEKGSPITYYKNVKTPVLIIHSENDLRCAIEQAEQMFVMLKMLKKTVEMVRFPEEPHGLSRHGRPDRRIARLEWVEKWFRKYL
ncbi:MAG: S9 family peptidase [Candidatus Zixiibacteriota bacterium]|nr:MAG: S9 family peptidase [candidate division Zixibacteria bacterium]